MSDGGDNGNGDGDGANDMAARTTTRSRAVKNALDFVAWRRRGHDEAVPADICVLLLAGLFPFQVGRRSGGHGGHGSIYYCHRKIHCW